MKYDDLRNYFCSAIFPFWVPHRLGYHIFEKTMCHVKFQTLLFQRKLSLGQAFPIEHFETIYDDPRLNIRM